MSSRTCILRKSPPCIKAGNEVLDGVGEQKAGGNQESEGGGGGGNENQIVRDRRVVNATRKQNQSAKADKLEMTEDHSLVEAK